MPLRPTLVLVPCQIPDQRNTSLPSNQFPCIACKEEVTWERDAICCDACCDGWMHRDCAGIDTLSFSRLQHSNCMWICPVCDNPNFSSVLFNSPITTSTDNRYSILADSLYTTIPDIRQLASSATSLSPTRVEPSIDISDSIEPHIGRSSDSVGSSSLTDTLDLSTEYTPYPLANSTPEPIYASPHWAYHTQDQPK